MATQITPGFAPSAPQPAPVSTPAPRIAQEPLRSQRRRRSSPQDLYWSPLALRSVRPRRALHVEALRERLGAAPHVDRRPLPFTIAQVEPPQLSAKTPQDTAGAPEDRRRHMCSLNTLLSPSHPLLHALGLLLCFAFSLNGCMAGPAAHGAEMDATDGEHSLDAGPWQFAEEPPLEFAAESSGDLDRRRGGERAAHADPAGTAPTGGGAADPAQGAVEEAQRSAPGEVEPAQSAPCEAPHAEQSIDETAAEEAPPGAEEAVETVEDPASPPLDPDEQGLIEPWPEVESCADLQTIGCHSHYSCERSQRCEEVNPGLQCCVPGPRGRGDTYDSCPNGGVEDCRSGICVGEGEAARCSLRCMDALDCPMGLRHCALHPEVHDGAPWCQPDAGPSCAPALPGSILINEVMPFAPSPERSHEFFELYNPGPDPVDLTDLSLWSNRGASQVLRAQFYGGCLPARAHVAIYEEVEAWIWSAHSEPRAQGLAKPFGLSNTADVWVSLRDGQGQLIDEVQASGSLLSRGVSLTRAQEGDPHSPLVPHDRVSLQPSSPGEPSE